MREGPCMGSLPRFVRPQKRRLFARISQALDGLQLGGGTRQLGLGFRDLETTRLVLEGLFSTLLRCESRSFVDVFGAQGGIRENGHEVRLHFDGSAADIKILLFTVWRLDAHLARLQRRKERRVPGRDADLAL